MKTQKKTENGAFNKAEIYGVNIMYIPIYGGLGHEPAKERLCN